MLRAFRWNLRVLSYISLVVGAFLIYNTIAVSVVRRRPEIGVLRALGASRRWVFWLFLCEALLFGLAGSLAGIALGRLMAEGAVGLIAETVNSLYVSSRPAAIAIGWPAVATAHDRGHSGGAGSRRWRPRVKPCRWLRWKRWARGAHEHHARTHAAPESDLGRTASRLSRSPISQVGPVDGKPIAGYAATLLAIAAMALAAPAVVTGLAARDAKRRAVIVRPGRHAGRARTGGLAGANVRDRGGPRDSRCHDGQRRHHGGKFSRNRHRLAQYAIARRPVCGAGRQGWSGRTSRAFGGSARRRFVAPGRRGRGRFSCARIRI